MKISTKKTLGVFVIIDMCFIATWTAIFQPSFLEAAAGVLLSLGITGGALLGIKSAAMLADKKLKDGKSE